MWNQRALQSQQWAVGSGQWAVGGWAVTIFEHEFALLNWVNQKCKLTNLMNLLEHTLKFSLSSQLSAFHLLRPVWL